MTLRSAEAALRAADLGSLEMSPLYRTPCFPAGAGPDYVNAAATLRTSLSPDALLQLLHAIERQFERDRVGRWASRTLDLDLIALGDQVLPDRATFDRWHALPVEAQRRRAPDRLVLPHPRVQDRGFVLVPLNDIAPHWRHPVLGRTVSEMLHALPPSATTGITKLERHADPGSGALVNPEFPK